MDNKKTKGYPFPLVRNKLILAVTYGTGTVRRNGFNCKLKTPQKPYPNNLDRLFIS